MLGEPTAKQPWVQIFGKSARADLWVDMEWEGKAALPVLECVDPG